MKRLALIVTGLGACGGLLLWHARHGSAADRVSVAVATPTHEHALPAPQKPVAPEPSAKVPPFSDVPDLTQTDPALALPGGGNSYCGPVAVSNALSWLAGRACPDLLPAGGSLRERQMSLVRELSSTLFMATSPTHGTGGIGLMRGLDRYLGAHDCPYETLSYQGWRGHPESFTTHVKTPSIQWIAAALERGGIALINVGWYRTSRYDHFFHRNGGHWLTVVGVGVDDQGQPQPNTLVLHDPAPYAGDAFANEYAVAEPLESGWLKEGKAAFPARGYYRLSGGMHVKREQELAILDGAITLVPAARRN